MEMRKSIGLAAVAMLSSAMAFGQDRLKTMPGYEQYQRLRKEIPTSIKSGALRATWTDDGKALEYTWDGKRYRFDVRTRQVRKDESTERSRRGSEGSDSAGEETPDRGRQYTVTRSPDGAWKATYRDRNVYVSAPDGANE